MSNSIQPLSSSTTLKELQAYVASVVKERGLDDTDLARQFMLLTEEVGEFCKAARKTAGGKVADDATAPASVGHEAADVLIVLLGICNMLGIDLEQSVRDKEAINDTRTWH